MSAHPASPTWLGLLWSVLPMLAGLAALAWLRLGMVRRSAVAAARMAVQLLILGVVLEAIFAANNPWVVSAIALLMLAASAYTVTSRTRRGGGGRAGAERTLQGGWGLRAQAFVAMGVGAAIVMAVGTRLALGVVPWYDPPTVIPLLGMVLGNSVSGVALAAERLDSDLRAERDRVELRLALGATSGQAATPALRAAVAAALTPTVNSMTIAGIVSIPGMMTGQVLAGANVADALRYQILIYLLLSATVTMSTLLLLRLRLKRYFTRAHQLRPEAVE